jgi:crotonobetainyl-CoA:carnitine CoA-transferase CaiB-like acyl-CoA transferase
LAIVADMDEIADDQQILASEALMAFADGNSLTVNSPIWIRGQQKTKPRLAPAVGERSEEVLRAVGYSNMRCVRCVPRVLCLTRGMATSSGKTTRATARCG